MPKLNWQAHAFDYVTVALSRTMQYLVTGTSEVTEQSLTGALKLWDLDNIDQNDEPFCLVDLSDANQVSQRQKMESFGVSCLFTK